MYDVDDYDRDSDSIMNDVGDSGSGPTSSGRKRRKPSVPDQLSLSFVKPSRSTKQQLFIRDSFQCWLCGAKQSDILQASHNLCAADPAVFQRYKSQGIFPASLTHPAHVENLILLCVSCHKLYDASFPKWIMLPEDLGFFINWEEEDYKQREEQATREGIAVPRTVPATSDYAGGFVPYFFDPEAEWMLRPANRTVFPKKYLGAPTTIILKAALAAFQPIPEDQLLGIGIQDSVMFKLYTLLSLYKRRKPSCPAAEPGIPGTLATAVGKEELALGSGTVATIMQGVIPAGTADQSFDESSRNPNRSEQCHQSSSLGRGPTAERPQDALPRYDSFPSRSTSDTSDGDDGVWDPCQLLPPKPFAFGPESTSAGVMAWAAGIRGMEVKRSE
ncbi:MAG: hypothetical protein M1840_004043 [Geoglossum simile]|nr:MAG: hypothetical protein M1840_004043 [Geoglossum simile]